MRWIITSGTAVRTGGFNTTRAQAGFRGNADTVRAGVYGFIMVQTRRMSRLEMSKKAGFVRAEGALVKK
ncbi:MAG: hypothetical protein HQK96_16155 [Nitrospirae bacterium]|nr:hypothetical protein [Nitrospirota bacterium]